MNGLFRMGNGWRVAGWGAAGAILLSAALATVATDAMAWGAEDFVAAALLLGAAGLAIEVAVRVVRGRAARIAAPFAVLAALLLVWAELAVGLVG